MQFGVSDVYAAYFLRLYFKNLSISRKPAENLRLKKKFGEYNRISHKKTRLKL